MKGAGTSRARAFLFGWVLATVLVACGGGPGGAAAALEYGARVRITSQALGPGWHSAVVGLAGECAAVMISTDEAVPSFTGVPFETITAMEISDRYPGGAEPHIYHAGSDTTGERWTALPVDALRERYAGCRPF